MFGLTCFALYFAVTTAQVQTHQLTYAELQQCSANMACSMDYSKIFQAKLDNMSHYMDLELALMRQQTNNILVPLEVKVSTLEANHSNQMAATNLVLGKLQNDVSYDRQYLTNLTQGLYILNDQFHKENLIRYQDVHQLVLELSAVKSDITGLQQAMNALLGQSGNTSQTVSAGGASSCRVQEAEIAELKNNLTYYMNAHSTSEKALENIRALETFLQNQVVQLKANLSKAESVNHIKDNLIVSLQNQLQSAQLNVPTVPTPGTCEDDLGMKDGRIADSSITASASQAGYGPEHARLDNSQGWYTPERTTSTDYLQIDTGTLHFITKVATQGAPCCDVMVTNYTLQYSTDGSTWKDYRKDCALQYFAGNTDTQTVVEHKLTEPIMARFVRFMVQNFKKDGVSNYVGMRAELYGCEKH